MKKKYEGFTLIEMLIVMGIMVILVTIGIAVGRYATQRSQDITHRNAARNLYAVLIKYKQENGSYPRMGSCTNCIEQEFFAYALGYKGVEEDHLLVPYMEEEGLFEGGSDATYYYGVDEYDAQFVVVCVSFGGIDDQEERGFFCTGDGMGDLPESNPIAKIEIDSQESGDPYAPIVKSLDDSDWKNNGGFASTAD